jgi:hypothetical protein
VIYTFIYEKVETTGYMTEFPWLKFKHDEVRGYSGKGSLVIDPPLSLLWATYYGGNGTEGGNSIACDGSGNVFVTSSTTSEDFPVYDPGGGAYFQGNIRIWNDAFILKFSNLGDLIWATYYGGNDNNYGTSIKTDASGNFFLTGWTWSTNFNLHDPGGGAYFQGYNAGFDEVFILKFEGEEGVVTKELSPTPMGEYPRLLSSFYIDEISIGFARSNPIPLRVLLEVLSGKRWFAQSKLTHLKRR